MSVKVGEMFFELVGRDTQFRRMMDAAEGRVQSAGRSIGQFGATMTRNVTLPLAAAGGAIVKFGGDFDAAMTRSTAIMGDMSEAMRRDMAQAAIEVSTTTSFAANEAAEAYFYLASAGLDAAQSIEALPAVATFAQAGAFDLALATDLLTDAQSALGMASSDAAENLANMTRIGDVLVQANTLANASVQQFASALTNGVAPAARNAGIEVEEVTAVLATLADQGLKGEAAGTALTGVLSVLPRIAGQNAAEFERLGIRIFDAEGNMRGLADIVEDVTVGLDGMSDEQQAAAFAAMGLNRNILDTMRQLMGTSDQIREYEASLRGAAGTMDEVASKQLETLQEQMKLLKDQVLAVGLAFYDDWEPALRSANESLQEMTVAIRAMDPETRKLTTTIALIAGSVGIAAVALSKLIAAIGSTIGAFKAIVVAGATVVGFLGGPLTAALVAIVASIVAAYRQIRERGDGFWSWFIDGWRNVPREAARSAQDFSNRVQSAFRSMADGAISAASRLYSGVRDWLVDKGGRIVAQVQAWVVSVVELFRWMKRVVVGGSYVPDMIEDVKWWMIRLGSDALVDPATAATEEAAEAFKRMNDDIKRTIADLGQALRTEQRWARLTGDQWSAMEAEARLLEGAIRSLLQTRRWDSAEVQELWRQYRVLTDSVEGHAAAVEYATEQERQAAEAKRESQQTLADQERMVRQFVRGAQADLIEATREEENQWEAKARAAREMLGIYPDLDAELRKLIELYDLWAQRMRDADERQQRLNESLRDMLELTGNIADSMGEAYAAQKVLIDGQNEWREALFTAIPQDAITDMAEALGRIPEHVAETAEEAGATIWDYIAVMGGRAFRVVGNSAGAALGTIMRMLERMGVRANSTFGRLLQGAQSFLSVSSGPLGVIGGIAAGIGRIFGLADGGRIRTPGTVMVGEQGPELLHLPRAATVEPLGHGGGEGAQRVEIPVYIGAREVARAIVPDLSREYRLRGVTT